MSEVIRADRVQLSELPLDPATFLSAVASAQAGATALFVGTVRDHADGRLVMALTYEAYARMALAELERIVVEAEARWAGLHVAVGHRTGRLTVGEVAVVVAAAHAHRAAAFEGCRYVIEELKARVPIWKHEEYADGAVAWVAARDVCASPAGR